jgi:deoxyribodipyrimidine photo-lyase
MKTKLSIYWSRRDFRLADNPALSEAVKYSNDEGCELLPIFILEDYMIEALDKFQFGWPSRRFLSKALPLYAAKFEKFIIVKGKGAETFVNLSKDFEIKIFVNEDVYVDFYKQIEKLKANNIDVSVYSDQMTVDKETVSGTGNHYSVFTPFKKAIWSKFISVKVLDKVNLKNVNFISEENLKKVHHKVDISEENIWKQFSHKRTFAAGGEIYDIDELLDFHTELEDIYIDEDGAIKHFQNYLKNKMLNYKDKRDSLSEDGTSKMSLALCWGLVSASSLTRMVQEHFDNDFSGVNWFNLKEDEAGPVHYISELIWREFYKYLLYHNPKLMHVEFQEKFRDTVKWVSHKEASARFISWIKGETGYKVVDAAMMQLAKTGWMHNRARMIVASVLTKNLGVDWRWGQEYFRAMLLDLDEASNNGGWQWGASVGADPKPIRIFNPYLQAENYDKQNIYQKKWLGEERFFFGPSPIVEHKDAREDALKRYGLSEGKDGLARDY